MQRVEELNQGQGGDNQSVELVLAPANNGHSKASRGIPATFYWRPFGDEGKAPIPVKVLLHYLRGGMSSNVEIEGAQSEANRGALLDQITVLIRRGGEYRAQLLLDELDDKSLKPEDNQSARKLQIVEQKLKELQEQHGKMLSIWQLRAERILCPVLLDDYLEINGEKIKVERDSIATMDNLYLIDLYGGVTNFLVDVTKRKNGS
jgi:succinate dehydrogenase/fumarate reductase flavoprotein subunit